MRVYKYKNATIYIYGDANRDRLEKATIQFVKSIKRKAGS